MKNEFKIQILILLTKLYLTWCHSSILWCVFFLFSLSCFLKKSQNLCEEELKTTHNTQLTLDTEFVSERRKINLKFKSDFFEFSVKLFFSLSHVTYGLSIWHIFSSTISFNFCFLLHIVGVEVCSRLFSCVVRSHVRSRFFFKYKKFFSLLYFAFDSEINVCITINMIISTLCLFFCANAKVRRNVVFYVNRQNAWYRVKQIKAIFHIFHAMQISAKISASYFSDAIE
jgi:hypothetical protein